MREQLLHHTRSIIELELLGSGQQYDHALREIELAEQEEANLAQRRTDGAVSTAAPSPSLFPSAIPAHMRVEMGAGTSASTSGGTSNVSSLPGTGAVTPMEDLPPSEATDGGTTAPGTGTATPMLVDESTGAGAADGGDGDRAGESPVNETSELPEASRRSSRRFQSPTSAALEASIEMTPGARKRRAYGVLGDLLGRGPRPLRAAWRDWTESRDFGPLLELITEEELEKLEAEALRASPSALLLRVCLLTLCTGFSLNRRGRREQARVTARSYRSRR